MNYQINNFVRRQTKESRFSYTTLRECDLLHLMKFRGQLTQKGLVHKVIVPVAQDGVPIFYTSMTQLVPGQTLIGGFESRHKDEAPRQWIGTSQGEKLPATHCTIICYHSSLLKETGDNDFEDAYEVISINAGLTEKEPINPYTLMCNHFGIDGGTPTGLSDTMFVRALEEAFLFHFDKAMYVPTKVALEYVIKQRCKLTHEITILCIPKQGIWTPADIVSVLRRNTVQSVELGDMYVPSQMAVDVSDDGIELEVTVTDEQKKMLDDWIVCHSDGNTFKCVNLESLVVKL